MVLGDYVEVLPGTNLSRIKGGPNDNKFLVYNQQVFNDDYDRVPDGVIEYKSVYSSDPSKLVIVEKGDLIFNLTSQQAAVVLERDVNLPIILPNNYCKITVKNDDVAMSFLDFWLNESPEAAEQYGLLVTGNLKKLAIKHIVNLEISLPEMEVQTLVGEIHEDHKHLAYLQNKERRLQRDLIVSQLLNDVKGGE